MATKKNRKSIKRGLAAKRKVSPGPKKTQRADIGIRSSAANMSKGNDRDLTKRKRAQKVLEEKQRLNELLLDSIPHTAMLIRKDRRILAANRLARDAGAKVGGYCWQGFAKSDFIPEEDKKYIDEHKKAPPGGTRCYFCLADEVLRTQKPARNPELNAWGKIWDVYWIPLDKQIYLHYAIDITERKRAEADLIKYREQLEELVRARTEELTQANKQLLRNIEDRKRLEREILDVSDREQQRVGRELHDSVGQQLTGIGFMTKALEQKLAAKSPDEAADLTQISKLVKEAMEQARDLAKGLHPVDLDAGGLVSSLEELAESTQKLFGIRCTFKCDRPIELENTEVAAHLYRMTKEAITNAIKHGKAKNIQIALAYGKDESTLTVKSDGLDFPKASRTKGRGMGLQIMGHRADIIGGSLDIHKATGGGTIVICRFPNPTR